MKVTTLELHRFRSFEYLPRIDLGAISIFIGANNAGKSTILRALYAIQQASEIGAGDVRVGGTTAEIKIGLTDLSTTKIWSHHSPGAFQVTLNTPNRRNCSFTYYFTDVTGTPQAIQVLPSIDPDHFVVPYLSKRKTATYHEDVRSQHALQVIPSMQFLAAKLSRISNPSFPGHEKYRDTCIAILGFMVTAIPSEGGQRPGIYLPNRETLPIDQMGEGVANIVMLLADLALSEGKLFLIEEPENDLHPKALKALLELITASSTTNQFAISTHSNIVLRHLGSVPDSKVYEITSVAGQIPVEAKIRLVEPTAQARLEVLRDLGYSFSDFELWDGWLFLEEASAERIVRDYLIPWFVPTLSRVRTLAAGGASKVEPAFEDFYRLVLFTHLERAYTNSAWVRVDGDVTGHEVIKKLQERFPTWDQDRFDCFEKPQFEHYYPMEFTDRIQNTLAILDKQLLRNSKFQLLEDVRSWLDEDPGRGREALQISAHKIIEDLKNIAKQLQEIRH